MSDNGYGAVLSRHGFHGSGKKSFGDELVFILKRNGVEKGQYLSLLEDIFSSKETALLVGEKSIKIILDAVLAAMQKGASEENIELLQKINNVIKVGCLNGVLDKEQRVRTSDAAYRILKQGNVQLSIQYYMASIIRRTVYSLDLTSANLRGPLYSASIRLIFEHSPSIMKRTQKASSSTTPEGDEKIKNPVKALFVSELFAILSLTVYGSKEYAHKDSHQIIPLLCSYVSSTSGAEHAGMLNVTRRQALLCLRAYTVSAPQLLYPHWGTLFPMVSTVEQARTLPPTSIFGILLNDDAAEMKVAASEFLLAFVTSSQPYMVAVTSCAGHSASSGSFTSFTQALGATLRSVHRVLLCALTKAPFSSSSSSLLQSTFTQKVLLCLTKLVSIAPYKKLGEELLSGLIGCLPPYLSTVEGLGCLTGALNALAGSPVVASAIVSAGITRYIFATLSASKPVVLEGLKALGAIARGYPRSVEWAKIHDPLLGLLSRGDLMYQAVASVLSAATSSTDPDPDPMLWSSVVPKFLEKSVSHGDPAIKSASVTILANLSLGTYGLLTAAQKDFVKATVLHSIESLSPAVRAAGWGVFSVLCMFASDPQWVSQVVSLGESKVLKDSVQNVRIKALQALGNCPSIDGLDAKTMAKVAGVLVDASADHSHEKVQVHALRGLASIFSDHPEALTQAQMEKACKAVIKVISSEGIHPKTLWNACIVLGSVIASPLCPKYRESGVNALCTLLRTTQNYKVKIQASQALGLVPSAESVHLILSVLSSELHEMRVEPQQRYQKQTEITAKYKDNLFRMVNIKKIEIFPYPVYSSMYVLFCYS